MLLGSANRDDQQFEYAEVFDMSRPEVRHLSFGFGTHFCVGASLTRLEALLSRFPRIALAGDVTRAPLLFMRRARSIPLRAS